LRQPYHVFEGAVQAPHKELLQYLKKTHKNILSPVIAYYHTLEPMYKITEQLQHKLISSYKLSAAFQTFVQDLIPSSLQSMQYEIGRH